MKSISPNQCVFLFVFKYMALETIQSTLKISTNSQGASVHESVESSEIYVKINSITKFCSKIQ